MTKAYILNDKHEAVPVSIREWVRSYDDTEARCVAQTDVDDVHVSTVFLGLDHRIGSGPPLLFETMVFGGSLDQEQDRCTTWEQVERMHKTMVKRVRDAV